jgi:hypothetical protein
MRRRQKRLASAEGAYVALASQAAKLKPLAGVAATVLRVADAQGYPLCRFTIEAVTSET